jgi:hypothetical protein
MGTGIKLDAMYVPKTGSGDSATEKGVSGTQSAQGNEDAYEGNSNKTAYTQPSVQHSGVSTLFMY